MNHQGLDQFVTDCELLLNYHFQQPAKLAEALNAGGNRAFFRGSIVGNNKRLAIVGDAIMTVRLAWKWEATRLATGTPIVYFNGLRLTHPR